MRAISKPKSFVKKIPNILTIVRVGCFPIITVFLILNIYFVIPFYSLNNPLKSSEIYSEINLFHFIAGMVFVIASLTDFVDGYIARKYHCESTFGKLWDPLADKLIVNSVLILFGYQKIIPIYIPIIMIARDVVVNAYKMYAASQNVIVAADYYGKAKTVAQMVAIILAFFIFCNKSEENSINQNSKFVYWAVQNLLFYLATLLSVISLVIYIWKINNQLKTKNK